MKDHVELENHQHKRWLHYGATAPLLVPFGLLKGLIFGVPCALVATLASTMIVVGCLPYDLLVATRALYTTPILGSYFRFWILFFLPVAMIVYPLAFSLFFFVGSLFYDVLWITASVFERAPTAGNKHRFGIQAVYSNTRKIVRGVFNVHYHLNAVDTLSQKLKIPKKWGEEAYERPVIKVGMGLILAVYACLVAFFVVPSSTLFQLPRGIYYLNKEYVLWCRRQDAPWIPFEFLGGIVLNVLAVPLGVLIGTPLYALGVAVMCLQGALKCTNMQEGVLEASRIFQRYY